MKRRPRIWTFTALVVAVADSSSASAFTIVASLQAAPGLRRITRTSVGDIRRDGGDDRCDRTSFASASTSSVRSRRPRGPPSRSAGPLFDVASEYAEETDSAKNGSGVAAAPKRRSFMRMTEEQDRELQEKGDHQAALMAQGAVGPLRATKIKIARGALGGFSGGGGMGGGGRKGNKKKKGKGKGPRAKSKMGGSAVCADAGGSGDVVSEETRKAKGYAAALAEDGVISIDGVLPGDLADCLRDYLVDLRARATVDVESGAVTESQERFADVLLNQNRCDLKVPLGPRPVNDALRHLLTESIVRPVLEEVYASYGATGSEATLYEHNCFMSNAGARRQLVHADSVAHDLGPEPIMLTCFVALQDIDDSMGPTTWIKGTHTKEAHDQFYEFSSEGGLNASDELLRSGEKAVGTLSKGNCAIFDPRTLHCAGGNDCANASKTRALFYFSFKNPKIDHPGTPSTSGYGIADAEITIGELRDGLGLAAVNDGAGDGERPSTGNPKLDTILSFP